MKLLLSFILALGVFAATEKSQALLLEPIFGIGPGTLHFETIVPGTFLDDKHTGTYFGGRVGTDIMGMFFTALDYRVGSLKADLNGSLDRTMMGLIFGVDLPLVRAWAGYNFQDDIKGTISGVQRTIKGSSITLGAGLGLIPFIEVGLEYIMMTKGSEKDNTALLNISVPFDL